MADYRNDNDGSAFWKKDQNDQIREVRKNLMATDHEEIVFDWNDSAFNSKFSHTSEYLRFV